MIDSKYGGGRQPPDPLPEPTQEMGVLQVCSFDIAMSTKISQVPYFALPVLYPPYIWWTTELHNGGKVCTGDGRKRAAGALSNLTITQDASQRKFSYPRTIKNTPTEVETPAPFSG